MRRVRVAFAVLSLALCACGRQGTVYAVQPKAASDTLVGMRIPDLAFGDMAHAEPAEATPDGVAWRVVRGSQEMPEEGDSDHTVLLLSATLAQVDGGTLVSVSLKPPPGGDKAAFDSTIGGHPAVADMFRAIASEAVDAGLTHRAFAFANIRTSILLATVSMLPEIRQKLDDTAKASEQRDRDTLDNAYREDGGASK